MVSFYPVRQHHLRVWQSDLRKNAERIRELTEDTVSVPVDQKSPKTECRERSPSYWGRLLRVRITFSRSQAKDLKK